jgi:hypothetical protein
MWIGVIEDVGRVKYFMVSKELQILIQLHWHRMQWWVNRIIKSPSKMCLESLNLLFPTSCSANTTTLCDWQCDNIFLSLMLIQCQMTGWQAGNGTNALYILASLSYGVKLETRGEIKWQVPKNPLGIDVNSTSIPHWFNVISLKWPGNNIDSTIVCSAITENVIE